MPLSKSKIIQQFNKAARTYDRFAELQKTMGEELIAELHAWVADRKSTMRIADLGCGTGTLLESLVEEGYLQLSGFDIAQSMLEQAAEKCPAFVSLTRGDIESLPAKDNFFDAIVSNAAIQWCQTDTALAEIKRVLKPQGRALITTFGPASLHQWRTAFDTSPQSDTNESLIDPSCHRIHALDSVDVIGQAIDSAGLTTEKLESKMIDVTFDSVTAMFDSVRKIGATNAQDSRPAAAISKSDYRLIRSKFQQTIDAGNPLLLTYEIISVVVDKK